MKKKLRTQLSLGFALIILATVALISILSTLLITKEFESYMEKQQQAYTRELAEGIAMQYSAESGWNVDYIHGMGMYALNDGYIIKVTDADGATVWDAENHDMEQCHQIMQDIEERMRSLSGGNGKFVTQSFLLESADGPVGTAEITYYTPYYFNENAFRFVDSLNLILLVTGILSMVGAVCVAVLFARKLARPIVQVTDIADQIAQGNYAARADEKAGAYELKELSRSINNMAEQIERQENLRKQLTSDVTHELRTPLANLSAQLEVVLEGVWEPTQERLQGIYDEVNRLSDLVADLEKLQQIENNVLQKSAFDLTETARDVANIFEAEIGKNGLTCTVAGERVEVCADRNKMRQVLTNLLSNAIKYSREGGKIGVSVKEEQGEAVLTVTDDGIGISGDEKALIFERFYRADKSRARKTGGVGIGLTIVNAIVKAHGGKIEVESELGKGSAFTVRIPKGKE